MDSDKIDHIHKAIVQQMEAETRRIIDEEADKAAERVVERVRALSGQIATKVASWVHYHRRENEIRITVSLPSSGS